MNPDGNLRTYLETARISNLVSFISQLCKVHAAAVQRAESMEGVAVGGTTDNYWDYSPIQRFVITTGWSESM